MHNIFKKIFDKWLNNLSNNENNVYSIANKKKIEKYNMKLMSAYIYFINNHCPENFSKNILTSKIKNTISTIDNLKKKLNNDKSTLLNVVFSLSNSMKLDKINVKYNNMLNNITKKTDVSIDQPKHHSKHALTNYKVEHKKTEIVCPICITNVNDIDDDDDLPISHIETICGHVFCVECFIQILTNKNECPICREFINIRKSILISKNNKYKSSLTNIIESKQSHSDSFKNENNFERKLIISEYKIPFYNVISPDKLNIEHIEKNNDIIILTNDITRFFECISYIRSFDYNNKITIINTSNISFF
jgi:Zn finger protein HypA/HybF involved in hydrogenase expression